MEERRSTSIWLLALYTMLIVALLLLVVSGARLYSAAVDSQDAHTRSRSALSFVQSQVAGCEGSGGAYLAEGPEGSMLCLPEADGKFETRIYLYENALRSEFSETSAPLNPANSENICTVFEFSLAWERENLLRITADGYLAFAAVAGGEARE